MVNFLENNKNRPFAFVPMCGDPIHVGHINILNEASKLDLLKKMVSSIEQFDSTQIHFDELVRIARIELLKTKPILQNLEKSSIHMSNILESIDDPQVLSDIKSSTRSIKLLTEKLDRISYKVDEILNDEELTNAFKDATIGIGKLFNDIYD